MVSFLLLGVSVVIPGMIHDLQNAGVPINPLYIALSGTVLTWAAGACRSYLSRLSGTGTGLQTGTDTAALEHSGATLQQVATQGLDSALPPERLAAAQAIVAGLVAAVGAKAMRRQPAPATSVATMGRLPDDISGQFTSDGVSGLVPSQELPDQPPHGEAPAALTRAGGTEEPPVPVSGSIREIVPDWSKP